MLISSALRCRTVHCFSGPFSRKAVRFVSVFMCLQVLDVLGSFCVGNGLAVRSSQNHICHHLLPGKDLLLQTKLVDHVSSMHPNIYVGYVEGSAIFKKWYFEAIVDHIEPVSNTLPHIRVGWANTDGYAPYPGGGERWGANGVGDDMFSFGFDGINIWTGKYYHSLNAKGLFPFGFQQIVKYCKYLL